MQEDVVAPVGKLDMIDDDADARHALDGRMSMGVPFARLRDERNRHRFARGQTIFHHRAVARLEHVKGQESAREKHRLRQREDGQRVEGRP